MAIVPLCVTMRLNLFVLGLPIIEKHLFLIISLFNYLPVAFSGWLARSKHHLIYFYYSFCSFGLWLTNQFNGGLNNLHPYPVVDVVLMILLISAIRWISLEERNIDSQFFRYIFNEDNQLSVSRSYELKRDCSHLTSDLQRLEKRRRILVAEVEPVSGYETPIIESDKPFVPSRELSNDNAQTQDLPRFQQDCLIEIVKKLHKFHDFAIFSTICEDWRSACSNLKWSLYPPHPWSIHFQGQNIMNYLDDGRYVLERWKIDGRYYYGCVNGWILNIGSANIHILNLFSRTQTNLPILSRVGCLRITKPSDWYCYIVKFILFKACHDDKLEFRVVALFDRGGFIAFNGPQFEHWIYIQSRGDIARYIDVVLFRGRFYALCDRGNLFRCGFYRSNSHVSLVATQLAGSSSDGRYYLVKNADHLIAIFQKGEVGFGGKRFDTETFRIYRFDIITNWTRISEPDYLKGRALFISSGNSWTIDPAEVESCRTNSIYFVDDYWFSNNRDGHFIGVFDIANGTIEDFQFEMDQYPPNDVSPFSLTNNVGA